MSTFDLKAAGNLAFGCGDFAAAIENYSNAILTIDKTSLKSDAPFSESLVTILSNRAACYLRICQKSSNAEVSAKACVKDCTDALEIRPHTLKALYRRAQAHMILNDASSAVRDLSFLLHLDPTNTDAMTLLRQAKSSAEREHVGISESQRLLRLLQASLEAGESADKLDSLLRALLGLCVDESSHATEFTRHGGIELVCKVASQRGKEAAKGHALLSTVVTLLCSMFNHRSVAVDWVSLEISKASLPVGEVTTKEDIVDLLHSDGRMSLQKLCQFVNPRRCGVEAAQAALTGIMRILKAHPVATESVGEPTVDRTPLSAGVSRVQVLDDEESPPPLPSLPGKPAEPFLSAELARYVLRACVSALQCENTELLTLACDALVAFWSEAGDYFTAETIVDSRMESLEDRKKRMHRHGVLKRRAKRNAALALEENVLPALVRILNSNEALERARALSCFGRLITTVEDDVVPRKKDAPEREEDLLLKSYIKEYLTGSDTESTSLPALEKIKSRTSVTAALMTAKAELGIWALRQPNGMRHVLYLISTGDTRCQDVAAEVLCLAASADSGQELLATALESGAIHNLLKSPHAGIRAAAASTITKLSIRAKAMHEDSPEVSAVMNAALDVLRTYKENTNSAAAASAPASTMLSQSAQNVSRGVQPLNTNLELSIRTASSVASAERAVEVVAAMVGRSHVKEELVHGSFRVASAIQLLANLELDARSTAGYGLAHIFAALTVTNKELHAIALAAKDLTTEQYDQLKELQRIKGTKDEHGNLIEEKKEASDTDTDAFCRARIKRIVQVGGFVCLLRLLTFGSAQTQDAAARALRQMCVEESVRGLFIQQGALKACCDIVTCVNSDSGSLPSAVAKREAAHAVAKTLITTNPSLLQGHARLGSIQPLLGLAKDVDSSNLQQFEALLALTNLVSLGEAEQTKFVREKGVSCVHYLMFSDHLMVRRAACEVFCNCPTQDSLLRLLRDPEKVRLWVGLCEDWAGEENPEESFLIARACSGTLAGAAQDEEVSAALMKENIGSALTALLESGNIELIHRGLVIVESLIENGGKTASLNLLENGVVKGISKAHKIIQGTPHLVSLAQEIAKTLSAVMNS